MFNINDLRQFAVIKRSMTWDSYKMLIRHAVMQKLGEYNESYLDLTWDEKIFIDNLAFPVYTLVMA